MSAKSYDHEFSPEVLVMLRKREILGRANWVHLAVLEYNVGTETRLIERHFDVERKENPLLETTDPEAWLVAEFVPIVHGIRGQVQIEAAILIAGLTRYFRRLVPIAANELSATGEQQLWTTIALYRTAVTKLLRALYDRRTSVGRILGIPATTTFLREAMSNRQPSTRREAIILDGINKRWSNQAIARELDKSGLKPRSHNSFTEMLRMNPQLFYAMKSDVRRKYRSVQPQAKNLKL